MPGEGGSPGQLHRALRVGDECRYRKWHCLVVLCTCVASANLWCATRGVWSGEPGLQLCGPRLNSAWPRCRALLSEARPVARSASLRPESPCETRNCNATHRTSKRNHTQSCQTLAHMWRLLAAAALAAAASAMEEHDCHDVGAPASVCAPRSKVTQKPHTGQGVDEEGPQGPVRRF